MKSILTVCILVLQIFSCNAQPGHNVEDQRQNTPQGYQIGDKAEDFNLKNVDGSMQSLAMIKDAKGYIVVFTSNECPFAKAYEDRLIQLHNEMAPKGYPVIAINSNDGAEGGGNTYQDMVTRHEEKGFPFVYLKDDKQDVYPRFGATKTPHVFLLDDEMIVQYIGSIDDNAHAAEDVEERFVANAITALEAGETPDPATTKAIGCPIKSKRGEGGKGKQRPGDGQGPPSADKILERMDTNNDQQLSKEEVQGPLARDFDRLDVNNDGQLTKEELANIRRKG